MARMKMFPEKWFHETQKPFPRARIKTFYKTIVPTRIEVQSLPTNGNEAFL